MSEQKPTVSTATEQPAREQFGSRLGFVLASMGGAIGLGSVWKFPYIVGRYGGAAFIIMYLLALVLIAIPILLIEFALGRKTGKSYTSALKELCPGKKYYMMGILGTISLTLTLSFYMGIAGWTIAYILKSVTGSYTGASAETLGAMFGAFTSNPVQVVLWLTIMLAITSFVVMRGVQGGIEKVCNVLLPVLFIMIIVLAVQAVLLPGASEGLKFYLVPDFTSLDGEAIMNAIGLSFFTLGVGAGNLCVYGSYLDKKQTISSSTIMVAFGTTIAAILFGFIVFPASFAFDIEVGMGPPLVFITLPTIFAQMKMGMLFGTLFFILLFFACLTSTICIMEAIVGYAVDEWKFNRKKATWVVTFVVWVLGVIMMFSFGPLADVLIFGKTIFDFTNDILVSAILLPLGGLFLLLLGGWILKPKTLLDEINTGKGMKINHYFTITVKYIAPVAVVLMFLQLIGVIKF